MISRLGSVLAVALTVLAGCRRIRTFIAQSFYGHKYDTAKTLEAFSVKLRDEVDPGALRGDLVRVVEDTMQPAHVSLWLRPSQRRLSEHRSH